MFNNEKIEPSWILKDKMPDIIFKDVRTSHERKTSRNRKCFSCDTIIKKGDKYINHQFRYDYSIKTISFCKHCFIE